ncbi:MULTISPECIES: LPS O-antigen length regulator Wzz(fepE) [Providencia]|uniref:LPS O-antigen length regulator Wzz(fepE) n=1 Tax=Providencia TaxID=586 RepID=UPI0003E28D7B|nr:MULTISPECIES: LPS O-antigen length regulator Wzz(fepE) [Providencia]ETT00124.1 chain length determinant protein [Providencia alcalifaciens PAL-3]EUC97663.1 chain length determinant protein [Providencia alcalifaciens PAL-1]MTC44898.1 LPS O-antigen length regulator [Providencia sp. wls1922]MTC77166.1 LPS O-antigen length regulator [Providencia sp. wls1916]
MTEKTNLSPELKKQLEQDPQYKLQHNDEIDLMALIAVLFKNKLLIIIATVIVTALSIGVVKMLPQKWTSEAIIIPPTSEEVKEANEFSAHLNALGMEVDLSSQRIYNEFIVQYRSKVNQEAFVKSTDYFKTLLDKLENKNDPLEVQRLVNRIIADSIKLKYNGKEKDSDDSDIVLSFTAPTAVEAQDLMDGYIRYTASIVRKRMKTEVDNAISRQLIYSVEALKQDTNKIQISYDVKIERLKRAITIAKAAGITRPIARDSVAINDDPDYPIALGSEALEEKLGIELKNRDLALISEKLQNAKVYIENLNSLTTKELDFEPIRFILTPDLPITKDSPKSMLIVALGAILGFIMSCAFVLGRDLYRNYNQQNTRRK